MEYVSHVFNSRSVYKLRNNIFCALCKHLIFVNEDRGFFPTAGDSEFIGNLNQFELQFAVGSKLINNFSSLMTIFNGIVELFQ